MDEELSVREKECEWDPNKHHGKPCPTHQGGVSDSEEKHIGKQLFDNEELSLTAYEVTENLKKKMPMNEEQWKYFQELNDKLPNAAIEILNKLSARKFSFLVTGNKEADKNGERGSNYNRSMRRVCVEEQFLKEIDEDKNSYFNGQVIYHELGHCIDNIFAEGVETEHKWWRYASSNYKSKTNGMTLHDTIKKERRKFSEAIISDLSTNVYQKYVDEAINTLGKEKLDYYKKIREEDDEQIKMSDFKWAYEYFDAQDKIREEKFAKKFPDETYQDFRKKRANLYTKGQKKFIHEHNTLSDIASSKWFETSVYGSKNHGLGLGHSEYYYQTRPDDGLGTEFFANMFASLCCNNKKDIENTRKYFPESVAIFEELIEEVSK